MRERDSLVALVFDLVGGIGQEGFRADETRLMGDRPTFQRLGMEFRDRAGWTEGLQWWGEQKRPEACKARPRSDSKQLEWKGVANRRNGMCSGCLQQVWSAMRFRQALEQLGVGRAK